MVSVVMVSFNQGGFISAAIESVLAQTRSDWELFIADDGSTDASGGIIDGYCRRYPVKIRRVTVPAGTGGIIVAYRAGITEAVKAGAVFIAFLEADDVWMPANLEKKVSILESSAVAGVVYSDIELIANPEVAGQKASYLRVVRSVPRNNPFDVSGRILYSNPVPCFSAAVMRAQLCNGLEYPLESEGYWLDWFFWNQLAFKTSFYFIPEKLVQWRHHPASAYSRLRNSGAARLKLLETRQRLRFLSRATRMERVGFLRKLRLCAGFCRGLLGTLARYSRDSCGF